MHFSIPRVSWIAVLLFTTSIYAADVTFNSTNPIGPIQLPPPTGPYIVGTTTIILTDHTRLEGLSPTPLPPNTPRTFLAQIFYPTLPLSKLTKPPHPKYAKSPYMTPGLAEYNEKIRGFPAGSVSKGIITNSYVDAPVSIPHGLNKPVGVVIFSSGYGNPRSLYTTYHEDLASLGYVVVAMEHLYDAVYLDVPGLGEFRNKFTNTTEDTIEAEVAEMHAVRVADSLFILQSLADPKSQLVKGVAKLIEGGGPANICNRKGWWWSKNAKVVMYGHSLGGSTAAGAMLVNNTPTKLLGGMNLDGTFRGPAQNPPPPPNNHITAPFVMWGAPGHNRTTDDSWTSVYYNVLAGWKRELSLLEGAHGTFSDEPAILDLFGLRELLPKEVEDVTVGSIPGVRAVQIIRWYVAAFVRWTIRGDEKGKQLLDGEGGAKAEFPEVEYL